MFTLPAFLYIPLKWLSISLVVLVFGNLIFFTCLSFFGLRKPKRDYEMVPDQKKFVFVVPAHNEENVIGKTIESLINQNYQADLFDIVIIADNCSDTTVDIIKTYERAVLFENISGADDPRGKPHAIAKYVETNHWKDYDYIAFIDADNIVDEMYLKEMNSQLVSRPEFTVIQGYLGMKNVSSSITATGYASVYFITNRAVQYANYQLGWNAAIGGTGFVLDTDYLSERGWNPRSYTEDFELQVELSILGRQSGWNHFAKVYDEKPNSVIASHHQRTRWAQGHWYVAFSTTLKQVGSLFKSKHLRELMSKIETLFYSYSMVRPVAFLVILFFSLLDRRIIEYLPHLFSVLSFWIVMEVVNFLIIPTIYFLEEGASYFQHQKNILNKVNLFIRLIFGFIWNSITYMIAQLVGFFTWFKPQNNWRKTTHNAVLDNYEEGE